MKVLNFFFVKSIYLGEVGEAENHPELRLGNEAEHFLVERIDIHRLHGIHSDLPGK